MQTGADALVTAMDRMGVGTVFGVPGRHNLSLVTHLRGAGGTRFVGLLSTSDAVTAANGWARRSGKLGLALAGPRHDALDAVDTLTEAAATEAPVVLLVIDPEPATLPGPPRDAAHADHHGWPAGVAERTLGPADDVLAVLREVDRLASGPPGRPVVLRLAPGLLDGDVQPLPDDDPVAGEPNVDRPAARSVEHVQLRRAGNLVDNAENVLIWAGGGALRAGAGGAVAELAEKLGAPVMTTVHAAGLLPARHPCLVGMPPDLPQVGRVWDEADLIIAIGTDFDAESTQGLRLPPPDTLIAINTDAVAAGRHYRPDVLLRGDARQLTKALVDAVGYRGGTAVVRARLEDVRAAVREELQAHDEDAWAFVQAVAAALPDRVAVAADPCNAGRWLAAFHEWTLPRTLLFPSHVDRVGEALAQAIGIATLPGDDPVVAVLGDVGLLGAIGQLSVLVAEDLPVTVLVVDDDGPGRLRPDLIARGVDPALLDRPTPDLAAIAAAFGMASDVVTGSDGVTEALQAHIASPHPTLLVVRAALTAPPTDESRWYRRDVEARGL